MVVDDRDLSLELIQIFLAREGFLDIKKYDCPLKALSDIKKGILPDLIITDFRMPEMNGIEFLKSAFQITSKQIPSLILTGAPESLPPIPQKITVIEKGNVNFIQSLIDEVNKVLRCRKKQMKNEHSESSTRIYIHRKKSVSIKKKILQSVV